MADRAKAKPRCAGRGQEGRKIRYRRLKISGEVPGEGAAPDSKRGVFTPKLRMSELVYQHSALGSRRGRPLAAMPAQGGKQQTTSRSDTPLLNSPATAVCRNG